MPTLRYRCTACGNLTRFDVTTTRRTRAFHHFSVGGELSVEEETVLAEVVEDVTCRWCGSGSSIETVSGPMVAGGDTGPDTGAHQPGRPESGGRERVAPERSDPAGPPT